MTCPPTRLAVLCLLLPLAAGARDWQSVAAESELGFRAEAQGEAFDGRFGGFEVRLSFDPAALDAARLDVAIELDSVDSRNAERDEMLAEAEFFDSRREPRASYRARRFTALADGRFRADGELTLRGTTRPVALTFAWREEGATAQLDGGARIDRLEFAVGSGDWADPTLIAREVEVSTRVVLRAVD